MKTNTSVRTVSNPQEWIEIYKSELQMLAIQEWIEIYKMELQMLAIKEARCNLIIQQAQKELKDIETKRNRAEEYIAKYEEKIA